MPRSVEAALADGERAVLVGCIVPCVELLDAVVPVGEFVTRYKQIRGAAAADWSACIPFFPGISIVSPAAKWRRASATRPAGVRNDS